MYKFKDQGHYAGIPARNLSDAEWERFTANLSTRETALVVTLYEHQPGELPPRKVTRVEPEPTPEPTPPEQPAAVAANKKGGK